MAKKKFLSKEVERFNPNFHQGLTDEQVSYMRNNGKLNVAKSPTNKSYLQIILGNLFTFFNILMFAVAALLLIFVGPKVITNLMFLVIILFNILIGTIQECKSKHTIEKLKLLSDSKINVKRNGEDVYILSKDIVLDDILVLKPGDQIPADCIIVEDVVFEVNEALLTGESVPVKKGIGEILYAGSFIVSGIGAVRADKIANDTYISSIEHKAKLHKQPKSRLMIAINKIIRTMAFIAIPLAFIVFINEFLFYMRTAKGVLPVFPDKWGPDMDSMFTNSFFYGGTTIAYMIPVGMALLASIAMTTGVIRLSQFKTLAQDLYSVESLSRVNTLCLDKTGTLTDGTMTIEGYKILDESLSEKELIELIATYQSAFKTSNQTSDAFIAKFGKEAQFDIVNTIQFSSSRKYSAVEMKGKGWFVLGAPEYISEDKELLERVNEYASHGLRVVLLAKTDAFKDENRLPSKRTSLAMFILRDTIRPEVYDTMQWFKENDVDIKVISGDNVGTVSYIAKQSGISNWDKVVDMSQVKDTDDFESIVMNNSIFGRVNPDQKADIIAVLKKNGRVTGVTGDGLNDLLAFKVADCSIALANGAAATKNVANLILLDSNFANMKEAVFQGRRVVNNIQRSSSLFVMKDFLWLLITILPILLGIPHILQPTVMSMVNIFITGIATVFISLEPDRTRVTGNFFKNVVKRAVLSAVYMFIPVLFGFAYFIIHQLVQSHELNIELMKTVFAGEGAIKEISEIGWVPVISLCVTIAGIIIFFENCRPFTKYRKILFGCATFVMLFVLYLLPEYFIVSGTEMLENTGGVQNIFNYTFSHMGINATLALYRTMTVDQIVFVIIFAVIAYPLYLFNKKYVAKLIEKLLFSKREYLDE
ncbi:MAG: HAD-IC family P-type ATPase [Bacilli bacterium]|nr:HAD-IC family P-type ATPase [Bacilli bacterium]